MLIGDRWEIDESTARSGGQAVVYKAFDPESESYVAVKRLHSSVWDDQASRESYNRELQALYRLNHPNIVRVLDHGQDEIGRPFVVLEWIDNDLAREIDKYGAWETWDNFSEVGIPILQALKYAHSENQLHRDLKPENILMGPDSSPRIADFGISKIVDTVLSNNVTFAMHGTLPYLPPEMEASPGALHLYRDVYAFAVLSLEAITGRRFANRADVVANMGACDAESDAAEFFHSALHENPDMRPQSAAEALAIVEPSYATWKKGVSDKRRPVLKVQLNVSNAAAEKVAQREDVSVDEGRLFIVKDLNDCARLISERGANGRDDSLVAATSEWKYRLVLTDRPKGALAVVDANPLPASLLQDIRDAAWDGARIEFSSGGQQQVVPPARPEDAASLFEAVVAFDLTKASRDRFDEQKTLFDGWARLLKAKKRLEEDRGVAVQFTNRTVSKQRVVFEVKQKPGQELLNQPRCVIVEGGLRVRGDIAEVGDKHVVMYVSQGDPDDIPGRGELVFDSDRATHALRVQEDALDAVTRHKSAFPQLADAIAYPEKVRVPRPYEVEEFIQEGLDPAKQECVRAALGCEELMVVEGPPGTGKTTFIAELVLQYLRMNPAGRILLASQTHVALDNALQRIQEREPERRLIRLGSAEKMDASVRLLSVDSQKREWRRDALARGHKFLRRLATEHGLDPSALEISQLARSFKDADLALKDAQSRLKYQRDGRRLVKDELAEMDLFLELGLTADGEVELSTEPASPTTQLQRRSTLEEEISAFEESISNIAAQVDERKKDFGPRREVLAAALNLPPESTAEELLEAASAFIVEDPALRRLYDLHLEWEKVCGLNNEFVAGLVARAEVVAGTCVGVGTTAARSIPFNLCILDEASKATATEALVPMSMASASVLVGDRKQLPPFNEEVMHNSELMRRYDLQDLDLSETLFDRLGARMINGRWTLTHQHRMVPEVGNLISRCFYDGLLTSEPKKRDEKLELILPAPVIWYTTSGMEGGGELRHGTSFANELEARIIFHLLESISNLGRLTKRRFEVAVLSGYTAQKQSIERRVHAASGLAHVDVKVNTVDAFQGQEADICIFSMTRSNTEGKLGFLKLDRRVNVALSRGKQALIVVGDADFCTLATESPNPMFDVLCYVDQSADCMVIDGGELL